MDIHAMTGERRHGDAIQRMATIATLLLNFGALIWFAATLNARVAEIKDAVVEQKQATTTIANKVVENSIAIEVLKAQKRSQR